MNADYYRRLTSNPLKLAAIIAGAWAVFHGITEPSLLMLAAGFVLVGFGVGQVLQYGLRLPEEV